ncbi:uncharacterized protein Bfra_009860 [Botrytis fragariae]|uniref:Uncharacterized protein n=1 Tax=Botrytis fragariae TaxID=1964551 RepID=A0A8H6AMW2_9HELO|nr:uncharacterized protein Bfra_009860 [Botrytis fragariae]KAF5870472.1 hypothetical protein Bfra_009860 [Botrytis fragariae]
MRHIARFNIPPRMNTVWNVDSSCYCKAQQNVQKLHLIGIIRRIEVRTEYLSFRAVPFTTFDASISRWISIFFIADSIKNTLAEILYALKNEMIQNMHQPLQMTISSFQHIQLPKIISQLFPCYQVNYQNPRKAKQGKAFQQRRRTRIDQTANKRLTTMAQSLMDLLPQSLHLFDHDNSPRSTRAFQRMGHESFPLPIHTLTT